jgi:methylmalonyl-CoA/ethylmalonyl-CoA epimerase
VTPFHTVHHVCIVVSDLDRAVEFYESIGIGPWTDYPPLTEYTELEMPDLEGFLETRFKVCLLGSFQLQLAQPGERPTPHRQFLDERGEGVFHMGFVVDDVDAAEEEAKALGLPVLMRGRRPDGTGFTYFDTADRAGGIRLSIRKSPPG